MHGLVKAVLEAFAKGKRLLPKVTTSKNYKHWISREDPRRCKDCEENHGKIYLIGEEPDPKPPLHEHCRCVIELMKAITAGTATINGKDGADWMLFYKGILPDFYISKDEAETEGWSRGKCPSDFVPGKTITGGVYKNRDGHLPSAPNRQWYEADINYVSGNRNSQRILWSNDGLVFVTYDHYETFYEIIGE